MATGPENEGTASTVDPARDFLDFWRSYFEQTAIQTRIFLETMQGGKAVDQMHHQWLESLSQSLDRFMRTPAFLEMLKLSLKRMIDLKLAQDQLTQSAVQRSGLPLASDVAGVFERVHGVEQAILARLDQLDDRLKAIEAKLDRRPSRKRPARRKPD
jgi:hypothetical protein